MAQLLVCDESWRAVRDFEREKLGVYMLFRHNKHFPFKTRTGFSNRSWLIRNRATRLLHSATSRLLPFASASTPSNRGVLRRTRILYYTTAQDVHKPLQNEKNECKRLAGPSNVLFKYQNDFFQIILAVLGLYKDSI
jgi:hypothetical protein